MIASKVFISDHNHGSYNGSIHSDPNIPPDQRKLYGGAETIERNVWIGEFVSIMPGVSIGDGCIIGSTSVVTTNIPKYSIAVCVPAKVIKNYDFVFKQWVNKML